MTTVSIADGPCVSAAARHAARFDARDLAGLVDDTLLAYVKAGDAVTAGAYLIALYRARIASLADWSVS